ncbi:MAG: SAM-dependent methyltransferase [Verrucomicrobia bacterium]|nr:MAG: SAM-dependent methyltransferase [Verrucomicrobiota bacterium]PYL64511.1 MAG: SAM-dependent methyltransferase [Verrucomicrobiota bacterium]
MLCLTSKVRTGLAAPFLELVAPSGRLLDAGCGEGRDTRFFIERGYVVISFDASIGMVRKCQEYPHAYCVHLSFSKIDFREEFDGVWACASLLHRPFEEAKSAVVKLATALKPKGIMFVSVRAGKGDSGENGRYFQYYDDKMVVALFAHDPRLEVLRAWHSTSLGPDGDQGNEWINVLVKRRSRQDLRNIAGQDPAGSVRTVDPSAKVAS